MRLFHLVMAAAAAIPFAAMGRAAAADSNQRVSGPHVFQNLAVYFVHGDSASGPVPLTLSEAMELGRVKVLETGNVNELKIENIGDEAVFIQAGDIVKGGKQDRAITASFILPPRSGEVSFAAFCVERGRWASRGAEAVRMFMSSREAMPSRQAKMAMRAPPAARSADASRSADEARYAAASRQAQVWESVDKMQKKFSAGARESVESSLSETSLQLSLENEKLNKTRSVYIDALKAQGEAVDDIVGYAFAINGAINSADVYMSNGLFRKMWAKQLQSAATEAVGETDGTSATPGQSPASFPSADVVKAFLKDAKEGAVREAPAEAGDKLEVRESDRAVYFAASPTASFNWVHQNFLAK